MRRHFLRLSAGLAASLALPTRLRASGGRLQRLTLTGPYAAVSNPLFHMMQTQALAESAEAVDFLAWKDPDQLRALVLHPKAPVHFAAMPTNVAANLYNRGVRLKLLNVSTWGVLWMVSREAGLRTLADFKGKELLMPFRSDMPDIVFRTLAERQGLDPQADFRLRYVGSPMDAMQLLVARRADHALLAEPAVSLALRKTRSFPVSVVAPELHRSVDLQAEWGRVLRRPARLPQAGIVALGPALDHPALIARFQQAYARSLQWCEQHADDCGRLVASKAPQFTAEGIADAVRAGNSAFVTAADARGELEFFFGVLHERQPGLVGGSLPDAGFYAGGPG